MNELKKCPFCGGTAMLCKQVVFSNGSIYSVACLECDIEVTMQVNLLGNAAVPDDGKSAKRMVDSWNRRAYEPGTP